MHLPTPPSIRIGCFAPSGQSNFGRLRRRARAGEMLFSCAVATALVADGDCADTANWWISGAYRRRGSSIENTQFDRADFAESPSLPLPGRIPACYPPAGPVTSVDHSL